MEIGGEGVGLVGFWVLDWRSWTRWRELVAAIMADSRRKNEWSFGGRFAGWGRLWMVSRRWTVGLFRFFFFGEDEECTVVR